MGNSWPCVDAHLGIRLVADPADQTIQALWDDWDAEHRHVAAPALLPNEVTNALFRYRKLGYLSSAAVQLALEPRWRCQSSFMAIPICTGVHWSGPRDWICPLLAMPTTRRWRRGSGQCIGPLVAGLSDGFGARCHGCISLQRTEPRRIAAQSERPEGRFTFPSYHRGGSDGVEHARGTQPDPFGPVPCLVEPDSVGTPVLHDRQVGPGDGCGRGHQARPHPAARAGV